MASFFDEIARNRIKSILMLLIFGAFFCIIITFVSYYFGLSIELGLVISGIVLLIYGLFVYYSGDKFVLKTSGAKPADKAEYPTLYSALEGLAAAQQIPMPKVYVINDQNPNAFATGRNKKHASIAVTTGLLAIMDRSELEAVIAHEASHIGNNDIQFMMIAIVFAGAIGIIAGILRMSFFFGGPGGRRNGESAGILLLIGLIVGLLAPFFAMLIRLAISRRREYMADANGARMTRDPASLASALGKIKDFTQNPQKAAAAKQSGNYANPVTTYLYFSNPINMQSVTNLFSTHPPIDERIKRLQNMH